MLAGVLLGLMNSAHGNLTSFNVHCADFCFKRFGFLSIFLEVDMRQKGLLHAALAIQPPSNKHS